MPPLTSISDEELRTLLANTGEHVSYFYNDIVAKIDRREARAEATKGRRLVLASVVVAAVAAIASMVAAIAALLKP
jgi:hypothetical protein